MYCDDLRKKERKKEIRKKERKKEGRKKEGRTTPTATDDAEFDDEGERALSHALEAVSAAYERLGDDGGDADDDDLAGAAVVDDARGALERDLQALREHGERSREW